MEAKHSRTSVPVEAVEALAKEFDDESKKQLGQSETAVILYGGIASRLRALPTVSPVPFERCDECGFSTVGCPCEENEGRDRVMPQLPADPLEGVTIKGRKPYVNKWRSHEKDYFWRIMCDGYCLNHAGTWDSEGERDEGNDWGTEESAIAFCLANCDPPASGGVEPVAEQDAYDRIIGRPDKPFHKAECRCKQCLAWIAANPLPPVASQPPAELGKVGYIVNGRYTCNGSPRGCEGGRFGGCQYCMERNHQNFGLLQSQLDGVTGALADAGDVLANRVDGDYGASVRQVVEQRDEARAKLAAAHNTLRLISELPTNVSSGDMRRNLFQAASTAKASLPATPPSSAPSDQPKKTQYGQLDHLGNWHDDPEAGVGLKNLGGTPHEGSEQEQGGRGKRLWAAIELLKQRAAQIKDESMLGFASCVIAALEVIDQEGK